MVIVFQVYNNCLHHEFETSSIVQNTVCARLDYLGLNRKDGILITWLENGLKSHFGNLDDDSKKVS